MAGKSEVSDFCFSRLEYKGIWGGIRSRDTEVAAGKVIGSVYSAPCEGGKGGDIYYFGVCKGDVITRIIRYIYFKISDNYALELNSEKS